MNKRMLCSSIAAIGALSVGLAVLCPAPAAEKEKPKTMLAHMVYFSLNDNSPAEVEKLVAACHKYLAGHPGVVFYAAGALAKELDRPVNDREFDVALHVVFADKAAHDAYQKAERHLKFIEANKANWKKVRVFDSVVTKE